MQRLVYLTTFTLSAVLLASCAASAPPMAAAPSTNPANTTAPAASAADASVGASDQGSSRAIHGSTIKTPPPTLPVAPSSTTRLSLAADSLGIDRMGFWNPLAIDPNGGSNANYGKDTHLVLQLSGIAAGTTASKVSLIDATSGGSWDSFGYPGHQAVGVYASDNTTFLLPTGSTTGAAPVGGPTTLNLYVDATGPDTPKNVLRAGDSVTVQLDTNVGPMTFGGLTL